MGIDINRAMSGRCSSCAKSFGLFNKEHGCFKCGFSFCGKCSAEKKIAGESKKRKVCGACFEALSKPQSSAASNSQTGSKNVALPPPENLLKREQRILDRLPAHSTAPSPHVPSDGATDASATNASTGQKTSHKDLGHDWSIGLGPEDLLIKQRLQKLKEEPMNKQKVDDKNAASTDTASDDTNASTPASAPASTDDQLAARVNALKGIEGTTATTNQSHLPPSKKLNQQDQVDELLQEIADEVEIDSHLPDPAQDVENRLRKLRGEQETGGAKNSDRNEMNGMINNAMNWKPETKTNGKEALEGGKEGAKGDNESNEKENDLTAMNIIMAEMAREMENDAKKDLEGLAKDDSVRQRLEELKEFNKKQKEKENDEDDEDEEETQRVIQRLVDEAKLEDHDPNIDSSPSIDLKKPLQSLGRQVQRIENNLVGDQQLPW